MASDVLDCAIHLPPGTGYVCFGGLPFCLGLGSQMELHDVGSSKILLQSGPMKSLGWTPKHNQVGLGKQLTNANDA